jgi:hypothetical protein
VLINQRSDFLAVQRRIEVAKAIVAVAAAGDLLDDPEALGVRTNGSASGRGVTVSSVVRNDLSKTLKRARSASSANTSTHASIAG